MNFIVKTISKLKYGLLALLVLPFFVGAVNAADDLMRQIMKTADEKGATIHIGENVDRVGRAVFEDGRDVNVQIFGESTVQKTPSLVVKVTRFLLLLVIALSVTMILYNGLVYIIQTGQGKEGKNLIKNVVYIVIGILLSLFSVTIIAILQSVSTSLDKETKIDWNRDDDNNIVYNEDKKGLNIANFIFNF